MKIITNTCLRSEFSAQPLSKLNDFSVCRKHYTSTSKSKFLLMIVQSLDIIGYHHCGNIFHRATPTKTRQIKRERNYISRSCEKPKLIRSSNQHDCSIDKHHNRHNFLIPFNLCDMDPAALTSLNHTNDRDSISISTLNQQLTKLEQTHTQCSFVRERWTVKRRDSTSALHFFK